MKLTIQVHYVVIIKSIFYAAIKLFLLTKSSKGRAEFRLFSNKLKTHTVKVNNYEYIQIILK